jgi:hypothetical protein
LGLKFEERRGAVFYLNGSLPGMGLPPAGFDLTGKGQALEAVIADPANRVEDNFEYGIFDRD